MSEIKTDKLTGVGTAGVIVVTGEGNSTTTNLQQGLAKAWVSKATDGTQSIQGDSFNASSLTDVSTGQLDITVTDLMNNNGFCVQNTTTSNYPYYGNAQSTSKYRLISVNSGGSVADGAKNGTVYGDLA